MRRSAAPSSLQESKSRPAAPVCRPPSNKVPCFRKNSQSRDEGPVSTMDDVSNQVRSTNRILSLLTGNSDLKDEEEEDAPAAKSNFLQPIARRNITSTHQNLKFEDKEELKHTQHDDSDTKVFEAVYRKMQTKKHKTWEGDGKVEVSGRSVILKDENGKEMGRIQKVKDDVLLEEGTQLVIGGKEVEFLGLVSKSMSGKRQRDPPASPPSSSSTKKPKVQQRDEDAEWYLELPGPSHRHQLVFNGKGLQVNRVSVDGFLAKSLRPHQREGVEFMYRCVTGMAGSEPRHGVLLADEMGLGKTLQCIALFWTLLKKNVYGRDPAVRKVLIVTPSSLVRNWDREITFWLKMNRVQAYVVGEKRTLKEYRRQRLCPVVIISYETLVKNMHEALQVNWDLLICDEAHRLKNPKTKTAQELRRLQCPRRVILTGSPCQNNLMEYFELLDFANPGILGTRQEFMARFAGPIERGNLSNASEEVRQLGQERRDELRQLTSTFVLGRPAEVNIQYLPPKQDLVVYCPLTPLQKEMYEAAVEFYWGDDELRKELDLNISSCNALCAITNLRQICSHPDLMLPRDNDSEQSELRSLMRPICQRQENCDFIEKSGKMLVVSGILQVLNEANQAKIAGCRRNQTDRVLVISYFTETLNKLQRMCQMMKLKSARIDGSVSAQDRMKIVTEFNNPNSDTFVMLLSAKAGGTGLNFDGASRVILYDLDWNPANDAQSLARAWRGKQKRPVITYRLLTAGTVEEKIFQRQIQKSGYNPNKKSKSSLSFSKEELKDLFSYDARDEEENRTHTVLGCDCNCDGTNVSQDQLEQESDSFAFDDEADKMDCRFPTIDELALWQHLGPSYNPQTMEDLNLALVAEWVLFIFRSQLLCGP